MMFEQLMTAADRGELILIDGAMCRYHKRRDGQVTIYEIMVLPECRGKGLGRRILWSIRIREPFATSIFAKCPVDLPANGFWEHVGFENEGVETTRTGRELNCWRLHLGEADEQSP